jgi:hypothetical protein
VHLSDSDVRLIGLGGLIRIKLSGPILTSFLSKAVQEIPVGQLREDFDIAIPACITVEGEHSKAELDHCVGNGLLRHVAGARGIRVHLRQTNVVQTSDEDGAYMSGDLALERIGLGMRSAGL